MFSTPSDPFGAADIEDAARYRRPSRLLGVGCTEEGSVDRRRLGFWKVYGEPTRKFVFRKFNNRRFVEKPQLPVRLKATPGGDLGKKVSF